MSTAALPANDIAVQLHGVGKRFGHTIALHSIDLAIRKGEFFSLLGPSGCGKTTTLNLIGGFESASQGRLLIDGQAMQDVPPHRRPVNTVFQNYALFPHMSVAENVEFGLRMKQVGKAQRQRAAADMLKLVSLQGYEQRRPAQLSGGQRQRVALARALVNQPSVLLLDEPLGALDLKLRKQMQTELTRIQRQVGITFVYVTHDQEEAMAMSDRIAVMAEGCLLQVGTPAQIYTAPSCREVMEFIGSVNTLQGQMARPGAHDGAAGSAPAWVELPGLGAAPIRDGAAHAPGAPVSVLVRPERVKLASAPRPGALAGHIEKIAHLGFVTHRSVRLADGQLIMSYRLNDMDTEPAGEASRDQPTGPAPVWCWWEPADALAFPAGAAASIHPHTAGARNAPHEPARKAS